MTRKSHRRGVPDDQNADGIPDSQDLGGLLGAILGGMTQDNTPTPRRNLPTPPAQQGDEVLGRISDPPMMPQSRTTPNNIPSGSGDPLSDILGGILGGMDDTPSTRRAPGRLPQSGSGDPLSDILGSVLGGGGANTGGYPQSSSSSDPLGSILGGMFGGGQMGTGSSMGGLGSVLSPLADAVSQRTGIPREIASAAMSIIVPMLLSKLAGSSQVNNRQELLGSLNNLRGQNIAFSANEKRAMVQRLVTETGMDRRQARQTVNQAIQALGSK
jgi:hypothetical protein